MDSLCFKRYDHKYFVAANYIYLLHKPFIYAND